MMTDKQLEQQERIRNALGSWASRKLMDFRSAWKLVYDEYTARTGKSAWQGPKGATGMDNIAYHGNLDVLEAIVDELTTDIPSN